MLRTALAFAAIAAATPALADTHITFVNDSGQPSSQMYVKGGKFRMEMNSAGQHHFMLYDMASNTLTMYMPDKKQYMVFNEQTAAQMGAAAQGAQQQMQVAGAQAQAQMAAHQGDMDAANQKMQAAMANMTPQQQAMMQKMMANRPGGGNPMAAMQPGGMQMSVKDLGTTETVAGHVCRDKQMMMGDRPMSSMCVIDSPASLGIPAADIKSLEAMKEQMQKLVAKMGPMAQGMAASMNSGFAIKTTHQSFDPKTMKQVTETDTFKSLDTGSLSGSLFDAPTGYTEITMDQMMQGHHP